MTLFNLLEKLDYKMDVVIIQTRYDECYNYIGNQTIVKDRGYNLYNVKNPKNDSLLMQKVLYISSHVDNNTLIIKLGDYYES